eukprot:2207930-Amphidinium_carterae.2
MTPMHASSEGSLRYAKCANAQFSGTKNVRHSWCWNLWVPSATAPFCQFEAAFVCVFGVLVHVQENGLSQVHTFESKQA